MDPTLEALRKEVLEDWDDDERHARFLGHAQATQQLGEAAKFYRSCIQEDSPYRIPPQQVEDARKRMAGVVTLAVIQVEIQKTAPSDQRLQRTMRIVAAVVAGTLIACALWLFLRR